MGAMPAPVDGAPTPVGGAAALTLPPGTLPRVIDLHQRYGDFFRLPTARAEEEIHVVAHPDLAAEVLTARHADYRRFMLDGRAAIILGNGLLTSEGAAWKRQRKLLQRCFHGAAAASLMRYMDRCTAALLDRWRAHAQASRPVDLRAAALEVSLEFNLQTLFSDDVPALGEALDARFLQRFTATAREDARSSLIFLQQLEDARQAISCLIAERRERLQEPADLLAMFMGAQHRDFGNPMPDRQIVDEILGVMMAGHETVAAALTAVWFEISRRPEIAAGIRDEVHRVIGDGPPTMARLDSLTYTAQVILESLRLHPPIWVYTRQSLRDSRIGQSFIPAGSHVFVCSYLIHRHPQFWPRPEEFDPGRFSPDAAVRRHRHAFLPYSKGPRNCIGDELSMSELLFQVSTVMRAVHLEHRQGIPGNDNAGFLMRPREPILVNPVTRC
jgi:cytochrome P450